MNDIGDYRLERIDATPIGYCAQCHENVYAGHLHALTDDGDRLCIPCISIFIGKYSARYPSSVEGYVITLTEGES